MDQLKNLFSPIKIGKLELKNRLVLQSLSVGKLENDKPSARYYGFILARARGGAGLVTCGKFSVLKSPGAGGLQIGDDKYIPGIRDLVKAIHACGAKAAAQVATHFEYAKDANSPIEMTGPSEYIIRMSKQEIRALTIKEVQQLVEEHAEAARRTRDAGFDAVEFHIGMGYMLNQFLSPVTNKRTDAYGGSRENRMRMVLEILESTRRKVGKDFPIICRTSVEDYMGEGGLTIDDWKIMAPILENAGVDSINVQAGWHDSHTLLVTPSVPPGALADLALEIKKVVKNPVMVGHRISDPFVAERIIAEGKADMIALSRALIADPELPNKARKGRLDEIRYCIVQNACLQMGGGERRGGFEDGDQGEGQYRQVCNVNPRYCKEIDTELEPAAKPKKVFVIGGGPAGMQAAMTAATRGHQVTLYEKGDKLGGLLQIAILTPYKDELKQFTHSMVTLVKKAGVKVELNTEASIPLVLDKKPDAVIVAVGAKPFALDIRGIKRKNVVTATEVLTEAVKVGNKVVVIGGGMVGCETAEVLAAKGKEVTILEMLGRMANDLTTLTRADLLRRIRKANVLMEPNTTAKEITAEGVQATREGNTIFYPADTVVLATGFSPNVELATQLQNKVPEVYSIGDCVQPRKIMQAIAEGFSVGRKV